MITQEAIQKIADLAGVEDFKLDGKDCLDGKVHYFTSKPVHELKPAAPPNGSTVLVRTLSGFADLIKAKLDGLNPDDYLIHVVDHVNVRLIERSTDKYGRRNNLINVVPVDFRAFDLGKDYGQERFIVDLMSLFAATPDRDYVIAIASNIQTGDAATFVDNGITQTITVKEALHTPEDVKVKPLVALAPFRTFPECQQVVSNFLFRVRRSGTSPFFVLHEADGGLWKTHVMNEVRRVISTYDLGIEIVA